MRQPNRPTRQAVACQIGIRDASALTCLVVAWVLLGLAPAAAQEPPAAAQERGLELAGLDGGRLTEQQLQSGNSVLLFWASWSPRCRDIASRAQALEKRFGARARVLLVNFQEDERSVRGFLGSQTTPPVYLDRDGDFAKRYSVLNLPGLLVLRNGEPVYQDRLPSDADELLARLLP